MEKGWSPVLGERHRSEPGGAGRGVPPGISGFGREPGAAGVCVGDPGFLFWRSKWVSGIILFRKQDFENADDAMAEVRDPRSEI